MDCGMSLGCFNDCRSTWRATVGSVRGARPRLYVVVSTATPEAPIDFVLRSCYARTIIRCLSCGVINPSPQFSYFNLRTSAKYLPKSAFYSDIYSTEGLLLEAHIRSRIPTIATLSSVDEPP